MSEFQERQTAFEHPRTTSPITPVRPIVETRYDSVVREDPGMSGGAVAALVLAAIAAAVAITMLVMSSQQRNSNDELERQRASTASAEQPAPAQQPPVILLPQSQPAAGTVPAAPSSQTPAATTETTNSDIELAVYSKLVDDHELQSYPVDVKVSGGVVKLAGTVPSEVLKLRAETLAMSVKGVHGVINGLVVVTN